MMRAFLVMGGVRSSRRGDTIIEVLLAVTVFSAVAVGALSVMNRSVAITQQSLEITQVRQQIDTQAELLRYLHAVRTGSTGANAEWTNLRTWALANATTTIDPTGLVDGKCRTSAGQLPGGFVINPATAIATPLTDTPLVEPATYAKVDLLSSGAARPAGLWVQAKYVNTSPAASADQYGGYIDFYIQSCWNSIGSNTPMTISTTVRLYDPDTVISAGN